MPQLGVSTLAGVLGEELVKRTPRSLDAAILTSSSSGGFTFAVEKLVMPNDLDQAGSLPSFGVGVIASRGAPANSSTTWNLFGGGAPYNAGTAACLEGSINPDGMAVTAPSPRLLRV